MIYPRKGHFCFDLSIVAGWANSNFSKNQKIQN